MVRTFERHVGGSTVTGRVGLPAGDMDPGGPAVIAIHGGSYNSAYFDVPGYSLMDRAVERGLPILAIDRPGYGGSTGLSGTSDHLEENAAVLLSAIPELLSGFGLESLPVFMVGHSIGAAITLDLAALAPAGLLCGIAISGVATHTREESRQAFGGFPRESLVDLPSAAKDPVMFGGTDRFTPDMPAASYVADAPAPAAELLDINNIWHLRVAEVAAQVEIPVHYRHAEFDALWADSGIDAFTALLTGSPEVDAAEVLGVGHCIDFHRAGAKLQHEQLDFGVRASRSHVVTR